MKILYRDGKKLVLAEVCKFEVEGKLLKATLAKPGEPEYVIRPFPSEELLEEFFREVIAKPGDRVISLENTSFDTRLGEMLSEFDSLFDD